VTMVDADYNAEEAAGKSLPLPVNGGIVTTSYGICNLAWINANQLVQS
jgi:hypothetical protein